jgi:hypothetical protein
MYVDKSTLRTRGKTYTRYLLRESYREEGKVKHRTLMNLSRCSPEEIAAVELALKHKGNLAELVIVREELTLRQGLSVGAVWTLWEVAKRTGVAAALGIGRAGRLALWQVLERPMSRSAGAPVSSASPSRARRSRNCSPPPTSRCPSCYPIATSV